MVVSEKEAAEQIFLRLQKAVATGRGIANALQKVMDVIYYDGDDEDGNELNPLCSECRKKYEDEEKSDTDEEKVYHECSNCKGDMCDQYGWCVNCMKRTEKTIQK